MSTVHSPRSMVFRGMYFSLSVFCSLWFMVYILFTPLAHAEVVDRIVAIVNDEIITQSELMERLGPIFIQYQEVYEGQELAAKMMEARRDILVQLIEDRLILQKALEIGLTPDSDLVNKRIQETREKFQSEAEFLKAVEEQGLTMDELRVKYADQGLIQYLVGREVRSHVSVTPGQIQAYYAQNIDEFKTPERVRAQMILIKKENAERVGEAEKLLSDALFEDVVRLYSEGPNKEKGGDLGFVERGELVEKIDEVIFAMKVGEVKGPIETHMGYHFFKIDARQEEAVKAFGDVHDEIENTIYQEQFAEAFKDWMDDLKKDAFISIK